jgi:spore maturation protein CgeB
MRIVLFYHSLLSDWNHGNAHFLRGVATELLARGHEVAVYEPRNSWSLQSLMAQYGWSPIKEFRKAYPGLDSVRYDLRYLDVDAALDEADLVIVHEWIDPELVSRLGEHRAAGGRYRLLFHDTHHRAVTEPDAIAAYDLRHYDGVLAFGSVVRDIYLERGWTQRAWTWHEAADVRVFHPIEDVEPEDDLVWIGNWGDEERTAELQTFLFEPVTALGLKASVYGVRYPTSGIEMIREAGIIYMGWLPNFQVPDAFARARLTVHIPRRPYVEALPGIPTIRVFEALACGIPLICSPWEDSEGLFRPGQDFLVARDGGEMQRSMRGLLCDEAMANEVAQSGRNRVLARHTCAHRVDELLEICESLSTGPDISGGIPMRRDSRRGLGTGRELSFAQASITRDR